MDHQCGNCGATFETGVALELHRDTCAEGELYCRECGSRFREAAATRDGWHYECPTDDCDGAGLKEDLVPVNDARVIAK